MKQLWYSTCFLLLMGCSSLQQSEFEAPWERRYRSPAYARAGLVHKGITLISWPVRTNARFTRGFKTHGRPHHGIDLAAHKGAPILSAHRGYVIYVGRGYNGYGNLVIIDDGKGWSSFYAHLQKVLVKEGMYVKRGDLIGTMGRTGRASGDHLHFELRRHKVPVDPVAYLP